MAYGSQHSSVPARLASRRSILGVGGLGLASLALAACGGKDGSAGGGGDKPLVIVGCYGVQYMAQQVCGDLAKVVSTARPGEEPHDVELTLSDTATIEKADVIIQIPGFQPAVDDVIKSKKLQDKVLDVAKVITLLSSEESEDHTVDVAASDGGGDDHDHGDEHDEHGHDEHDHGAYDPHFWNDPELLAKVGIELGKRLGEADSSIKDDAQKQAKKTADDLNALAKELEKKFAPVPEPRVFVTGHTAFEYFARRFHLEQIGIAGVDPETEPSPQRLLALQKLIKEKHVSVVYFEESASPKVAETLAKNVGVKSESLDNCETQLDPKKDYPTVMRENADKLVAGWK